VTHVLWDASALAKRYIAEVGSDTVNALFAAVKPGYFTGSSRMRTDSLRLR
jgi:hypothetical protein